MNKEKFNKTLSQTFEHIKEYINLKTELFTLLIFERFSRIFSKFLAVIVFFFLLFFVMLFLSLAFVHWFADLTGHLIAGYLIVALFYLIVGIVVYALRKQLFLNPMIKGFTESMENDDPEEKHKKHAHEKD